MKSIKLLKTKRYNYKDKTYVHGKTYSLNDTLANELLRKEDGGLPYFIMSDDDPDEVIQEGKVKAAEKASSKKPKDNGGEDPNDGVSSENDGAVSV